MSFFKKLFGKKETPIRTYQDFWNWFKNAESKIYHSLKYGGNAEKDFINKISPKLNELKEGFFFAGGMYDDQTAELVITADGTVKNIVFVEELIAAAPRIPNWKFTALKPELKIEDVNITMEGCEFNKDNLSFYAEDHEDYPDEVDLVVVHDDFEEKNRELIISGTYIFLDNYLGELNMITGIDNLTVIPREQAVKELIPISKLKGYLTWREKEFVEKYNGVCYSTENDNFSGFEGHFKDGSPVIAIFNATLLDWDSKASHPWILQINIYYDGKETNGMPDQETYATAGQFEEDITRELRDYEGYLNIGRRTGANKRLIYFACKDFRKPSKAVHDLSRIYGRRLDVSYDIYKDKYWQSFERFKSGH